MSSPFHSGLREGNTILPLWTAAKAARVTFPPRIEIAGLPRSRLFLCPLIMQPSARDPFRNSVDRPKHRADFIRSSAVRDGVEASL